MKLYLVHHGEAVAKEVDGDRPLTPTGRQDLARLAAFLGKAGVVVARMAHSGKTRARQTAEILAPVVAPGQALEQWSGINPDDPLEPVLARLAGGMEDCLVAGHGPHIARLVTKLVCGQENPTWLSSRPGTLFYLESNGVGGWHLAGMMRPELLPR